MTAIVADIDTLADALLQSRIVETCIREVARAYGLDARQVTGRGYTGTLAEARSVALVLCAEHSVATHAQIAQRFMGRAASAVPRAQQAYYRHHAMDHDGFRARFVVIDKAIREALR